MNIKEIKELINLMNENNLDEIEIEKEGNKIRLKKSLLEAEQQRIKLGEQVKAVPPQAAAEEEAVSKSVQIKAPMVGTFYRAPSPESAPFVEIGQNIEPGQVICIIEAMKLMNEIKSEIKGKIINILAENGEPVEFGQAMFLIEVF